MTRRVLRELACAIGLIAVLLTPVVIAMAVRDCGAQAQPMPACGVRQAPPDQRRCPGEIAFLRRCKVADMTVAQMRALQARASVRK